MQDLPVAFSGRENTQFFGEAQNLAPFDYHYSDLTDGGYVQFPAGVLRDRLGHQYDAPLEMDEVLATDWTVFGSKKDTVIQTAQAWLESHPACK